jgi:hypothetical protein
MKKWESTMREAKQAFNDNLFSIAIFLNKQALDLAHENFGEYVHEDAEKSVAAVMVSYFSLADSYIQIRDFQQVYKMYQSSFNFLQVLMSDTYKKTAVEAAAFHGMSHWRNEWSLFIKSHKDKLDMPSLYLKNVFQKNLHLSPTVGSVVH